MAQMLDVIGAGSVTIALPSIEHDAKYAPSQLQWVVSSYALSFSAFLLVGGRIVRFFKKPVCAWFSWCNHTQMFS
jgi:MFS family permease